MRDIIAISLIIFFGFVLTGVAYCKENPGKTVLTMGRVEETAGIVQKRLGPIVRYLAYKLKDMGIKQGEVLGGQSNATIIKYLKDGSLDIVIEAAFFAVLYRSKTNAVPILFSWRYGTRMLSSFIFVRNDSGIMTLEGLKGKVIAFEDLGSTPEYFLPKIILEGKGFEFVYLDSPHSPVPEDKIGYVFAGDELNITSWVFYNKVDGGALSSAEWSEEEVNPKNYRDKFNIIYSTPQVISAVVLLRKGLDEELAKRIKEELLDMHKNDEGLQALKPFKVDKFEELSESILENIEDMLIIPQKEEIY
ncbi:MAG: putative anion binding protein [Candidatus Scalindua rubra]|uniref:Putative anion binding protein n=1 Tax=Candidatus Scalindua rubra TaxID=1872076 RepID=A0A1E3X6L4_9BACT|nr:MAG: putative anion binding protein [Candidatus Scalindua rubra]